VLAAASGRRGTHTRQLIGVLPRMSFGGGINASRFSYLRVCARLCLLIVCVSVSWPSARSNALRLVSVRRDAGLRLLEDSCCDRRRVVVNAGGR
jgi:hypothetical protein